MRKETKEVGRELCPGKGSPSREGNFKNRGFQTPGNTLPAESVASLGNTEGNITGRKNRQIIKVFWRPPVNDFSRFGFHS